jgi:hypothetical protein
MSFEDLVVAVFAASTYPHNATVASAAMANLAAYIVANGTQTFTDTNSGLVYKFIAYGTTPGYKVVPG